MRYIATGQAAKICNNLALAIEMVAVAEAMTLGDKLGISPKVLAGYVEYFNVNEHQLFEQNFKYLERSMLVLELVQSLPWYFGKCSFQQ
jgi:3-hydroxyisobutyrate dehydrogenase-like beta-hydroxyacid dehydrogenase